MKLMDAARSGRHDFEAATGSTRAVFDLVTVDSRSVAASAAVETRRSPSREKEKKRADASEVRSPSREKVKKRTDVSEVRSPSREKVKKRTDASEVRSPSREKDKKRRDSTETRVRKK